MSKPVKMVFGAWYWVAVVAALGFGSVQAFASPNSAGACKDDGENFLGECVSPMHCQVACEKVTKGQGTGVCDKENCCICFH